MTASIVQVNDDGANTGTLNTAPAGAFTAGNTIALGVFTRDTITSISDSGGRAWTASIAPFTGGAGGQCALYTAPVGGSGGTPTISIAVGSSNWITCVLYELAGADTSTTPLSTSGTNTDASTTLAPSATTSGSCGANELALGFLFIDGGDQGVTPGSGWTEDVQTGAFHLGDQGQHKSVNSSTVTSDWATTSGDFLSMMVACFKSAGGAVNVSANPTGVEATASAGTPTVSAKATASVTGVAATAQVNTPTVSGKAVVPVTGVAATGQVGTLTVSVGGAVSVAVSGVEATAAAGTPTVSGKAIVPVTGVEATAAAGTPTVTAAAVAAPTGVEATAAVGTPTVSGKAVTTITGVPANASAGDLTVTVPSVTVILVGVEAVGQVGDLVGIVPNAGGYWDTSDPLFYEWWRKAKKREEARKITPVIEEPEIELPGAAKVKGNPRPPSPRLAAALSTVESLADLKELKPLDSAYVGRLLKEYGQVRNEVDDDEVEALLILALS